MRIIKIKLSVTVCYLVPVENQYMLIDTGYERDSGKFHQQLKKNEVRIEDIAYILLTHHHDDHAGLVHEIMSRNSACRLIMHKNTPSKLERGRNDLRNSKYINKRVAAVIGLVKKLTKGLSYSFPPYVTQKSDIIISEDTSLKQIGINIPGKIVYSPGHTDDSISVLLDNGICLCGDAAANMLSILRTKHCVIVIEDLKQYYATWEKIIAGNISTIYPGHGKPFGVEKLRKHLHQNTIEKMRIVES